MALLTPIERLRALIVNIKHWTWDVQPEMRVDLDKESADILSQALIDKLGEPSKVNHPKHYNIPGRKECIEEMLDIYGPEKVKAFCELNAYKYRYRHELKNGEVDLQKAQWYDNKVKELENSI